VAALLKTCWSERKTEDNRQVGAIAGQLLAPSLSILSSRFATICQHYYYVFMTADQLCASIAIMRRPDAPGI
jgi:hypothetical protein